MKTILKQLLFLPIAIYAFWLIFKYEYHLIDHFNLVIHEAGHIVFGFFGELIHFLGGTLLQLIMPLAIAYTFYRQKDRFEMYVSLIWFGESMMYMAVYMDDAIKQKLPLVGGGQHDWTYLFGKAGVLEHCESIASFFHLVASILILFMLYKLFLEAFSSQTSQGDSNDNLPPPRRSQSQQKS